MLCTSCPLPVPHGRSTSPAGHASASVVVLSPTPARTPLPLSAIAVGYPAHQQAISVPVKKQQRSPSPARTPLAPTASAVVLQPVPIPAARASDLPATAPASAVCRVRLGGILLALLAMLFSPAHSPLNAEHMLTIHPDIMWQVQVAQASAQLHARVEGLAFDYRLTAGDVRRIFSRYGRVAEVAVDSKATGARITFDNVHQAANAEHDLHRKQLAGLSGAFLRVEFPPVTDVVHAAEFRCWDNATPCWNFIYQASAHLLQDPRHAAQMRGRAIVAWRAATQDRVATWTCVDFALAAAGVLLVPAVPSWRLHWQRL